MKNKYTDDALESTIIYEKKCLFMALVVYKERFWGVTRSDGKIMAPYGHGLPNRKKAFPSIEYEFFRHTYNILPKNHYWKNYCTICCDYSPFHSLYYL